MSGDMEPVVKALAHGPPSRIAKTILKVPANGSYFPGSTSRFIRSESTLFKENSVDPQKNEQ